jgi:hypothetical protein
LTARLQKTVLSEKMIEEYLSRVEDSITKSTYKLGADFERCEDKGEKSAPKFILSSTYHQEDKTIKSIKAHYRSNCHTSVLKEQNRSLYACAQDVQITCIATI